jgi:pilus assembly protein FimV
MSLRLLTSVVALLVPVLAAAAELGRLTVLSGVGEPLRAEIEIVAVAPGEAATLGARIPPADVFWRANLEPAPVIDSLRVAVERRPPGRYVVAVRSNGPVTDPFIQLLVELVSPTGSFVREYPFLLEEPRARRPSVAAPPPSAPPVAETEQAVSLPVVPRGDGYAVKAGDTLAEIAEALRPAGVTLEQMIVALYQANEAAFLDANMNRLRARETLAVPAGDAVRSIDAAAARARVLEHRAAFEDYRRRLAAAAGSAPAAAVGGAAPGAAPALPRAAGDRLRVSGSEVSKGAAAAAGARGDDLAALHHALGETKERISALEKNVNDITTLLTLKNRELARMEREARATGQTIVSVSRDVADSGEPDERALSARALDDYGPWLLAALLAGFVWWIVMPFKTLRLWLKRRRHRLRKARRAAERVRRAARNAGLLPSTV